MSVTPLVSQFLMCPYVVIALASSLHHAATAAPMLELSAINSTVGAGVAVGAGVPVGANDGAHVLVMEPLLPENMPQVDVTWLMSQQGLWEKDVARERSQLENR